MPQQEEVYHEIRGRTLWLTLNRPDAMNAINDGIVDGLMTGLDIAVADENIRCVVIRAEGRAFCAGAYLKSVQEKTAQATMSSIGC